jgi:hypothetical protein
MGCSESVLWSTKARLTIGLTAARVCVLACRHSPLGRGPSVLLVRASDSGYNED